MIVIRVFQSKKYFLCANLFNNENIIRDWTQQLMNLINYLGKENVYVSIFENGDSTDNTRDKLIEFKYKLDALGINNSILVDRVYDKQKSFYRIYKKLEKI